MSDDQTTFNLILNRFADLQKAQIERLYLNNPAFREICHDYAECIHMWEKYASDIMDPDAGHYRQDYEALIASLEEEFLEIWLYNLERSNTNAESICTHRLQKRQNLYR